MADKKVTEQYYAPPPELGRWEGFRQFLWNSETSQFLGRTGSSWAKIILFYLIFYSALIGFFAAMLAVFYQTLDYRTPKWQQSQSLIGSNPGLGFRPMPPESNVESTLVWYKATDKGNVNYWTNEIDNFLEVYRKKGSAQTAIENRFPCKYDSLPPEGKVCDVPVDDWRPCVSSNSYNYHNSAPCIFLKLNKIYNWRPETYNDSASLPNNMPSDLKKHIDQEQKTNPKMLDTVWVSCEGENPADNDHIGAIQYIPGRGFPGYYFPFTNLDGYLSPLVAVHFESPKPGVLINIECKAWAKNIFHDRHDRRGSVHFELMVD